MGVPKALLDFRGAPFIVRIVEALEALDLKTRVVVVGPGAERIRTTLAGRGTLVVENPDVEGGPIASLRVALETLRQAAPPAVLVWPVDLPHVRVTTIERLLESYRRTHPPVAIPTFAGRRGHPVIWDASLFPELEAATSAPEGARAVLHAHLDAALQLAVDDPAVVDAVNSPEDYERLVREWNRDIY